MFLIPPVFFFYQTNGNGVNFEDNSLGGKIIGQKKIIENKGISVRYTKLLNLSINVQPKNIIPHL
jgi:hypothetical protein